MSVLVLNILLSLWCFGKCFLTSLINVLPMLVLTFWLKGGLNQIILRFLFRLLLASSFAYFIDVLNPLSFRAFSYSGFALLNSSSLQDKSDNRLFIIFGRSFIMVEGWFDFAWIYIGLLFGFLNGKYLPVSRLNVTSKKSVSTRLISIVMDRPSSLKREMMFFLILSRTGPLVVLTAASPSSLYERKFSLPSKGDNFCNQVVLTNGETHQRLSSGSKLFQTNTVVNLLSLTLANFIRQFLRNY